MKSAGLADWQLGQTDELNHDGKKEKEKEEQKDKVFHLLRLSSSGGGVKGKESLQHQQQLGPTHKAAPLFVQINEMKLRSR